MSRDARARAARNRDAARRALLAQRRALAERRRRNRAAGGGDDPESRNPTAHSTVPRLATEADGAARGGHSTVPATPRYSETPARPRLYGRRLALAAAANDDERGAEHERDAPTASDGGDDGE